MKFSHLVLLAAVFAALPIVSARADAPLRKGDQFDLRIAGVPSDEMGKISSNYTIDSEGCLNLAYIGKVQVEGKSPSDIQSIVERTYVDRGIFTHPTVTVSVARNVQLITVGGEVNSKGRVTYSPDMTLMSAIGAAGDFSIYADQKHVHLNRGDTVKIYDCKRIRAHPGEDVKVLPGDNIQVPQSIF